MDIENIMTCSRGRNDAEGKAMCRYVENGKVFTCSAYMAISGKDPTTGKDIENDWRCVDQWIPIILLDNSRTNRGQTAAIESFRNVVMEENAKTLALIQGEDNACLPR